MSRPELRAVAFGACPGARVGMSAGRSPHERWFAAVALGGQGHYAAAAAELARLRADPRVPAAVAAHAAVTTAAHRRQLGGHAAARPADAEGLRIASAALDARRVAEPDADGTDPLAALVDALVGLAADAVGLGEHGVAQRLLDAARSRADDHPSWRLPVRIGWVRAELALVRGRAAEAVEPASAALQRALDAGSVRHALKSRIVMVVAHAAAGGDPDAAVAELDAVASECAYLGQIPLEWPCHLAAADLIGRKLVDANERMTPMAQRSVSDRSNDMARRRHAAGSALSVIEQRSDPLGRRLMGVSVWLPRRPPVI